MRRFSPLPIPLASIALLLGAGAGCRARTDLDASCKMTRAATVSGGAPIDLTPDQVQNPDLDYVAFGAAECDNLVCIRTAGSANPENQDGLAMGYCSAPCTTDSDCSPDLNGARGTLVCADVLPEMAALQQDNPVTYAQTFSPGTGASNRYCIRPRSP